jgi:hypothetical protein
LKSEHNNLVPVDVAGVVPEHIFGLHATEMPPALFGWLHGLAPYYRKDGIVIFRGKCERILAQLPASWFDLLLTDPPYGIKLDTSSHGGRHREYKPVRGDDRPFDPSHLLAFKNVILWGANYYAHMLPRSTKWLVWDKRAGVGQNCQSDAELAWTQGLPGVATRALYHYWNGACRASEREIPRLHPTQKPIALMRWCIEQFAGTRTVIDPYMGVGTTLVAAKQLGLQAIGIEWDEQYCRAAADRVEATSRLVN